MSETWEAVGWTIREMAERFTELGAAFPASIRDPDDVAKTAAALRRAELETRSESNEIMNGLILGKSGVGRPSAALAFFCMHRCLCALDTVGLFDSLAPEPPNLPRQKLMQWALITLWLHRGDSWLNLVAYNAQTSRGPYN